MYRFLRKNNKKLLAIFTAFLMIVFILPSSTRMFQPDRNRVIGHIGDEKIMADQVRQSQLEWDALKRVIVPSRNPQARGGGEAVWHMIFPPDLFSNEFAEQVGQNSDMFYLLQREAKKMGAQPNEEAMQQLMTVAVVQMDDGRIVPIAQADDDRADLRKAAIADLLLVANAWERQLDLIKISQPVKQYQLATEAQ